MNRILQIAWREFLATVLSKGFLLGLVLVPVMMALVALIIPWLVKQEQDLRFEGQVLVLDPSGRIAPALRAQLAPEAFAERRLEAERRIAQAMPDSMRGLAAAQPAQAALGEGIERMLGEVPQIEVVELPAGADAEATKASLRPEGTSKGGRIALLQFHPDALAPAADAADGALGSYEFFVRDGLEDRVVDALRSAARQALIETRMAERQLDAKEIRELTRVPHVPARKIGAQGEKSASEVAARLLPMAFMMLIFIAVMTAGQHLMTSTIEEKSSRVVEVLLAAVSPQQLMAGKILGQLAVASLMLALYGGLGLLALTTLAVVGVLDPLHLLYLIVFFLIAFVTLASLMAAIGAAVNEMREAQSLLMPVVLTLTLPMMLWMPITRDPNGALATILSLTPPVSPFVMLLRITSSAPPPVWQILLSIALGIAGVFAAIWFAGKVFRVGLLMHGKPPNLATLWRWVRMA